jgi:Zn-dependent peptidase ImmA (M78 family)
MSQADYVRAEASQLTKLQVWALAESVANQLDFKPCGEIAEIVSKLGGKVKVQDTLLQDPEHSGSLFVEGPDDFTIVIPSHTSQARDRFTIAHELGHFVVHYLWRRQTLGLEVPKMMALRKDSDRVEWEANWFAAAFLMPADQFRAKHAHLQGDLDDLASAFCVSRSAAEVRARSLGL